MVTHYFTLYALCRELEEYFLDAVIEEVFTQHKDELYITLTSGKGVFTLSSSVDPPANHFLLRDNISRAKKNSVDLFPSLVGKRIAGVGLLDFDRTIAMTFRESPEILLFQLYNSAQSNIFLVGGEKNILDAFKRGKGFEGKSFPAAQLRFDETILNSMADFEKMVTRENTAIYQSLRKNLPIFGSTYVREILYRTGIEESVSSESLNGSAVETLFNAATAIYAERKMPRPAIYFRGEHPDCLSMLPLSHLSELRVEYFDSVNQAVKVFLTRSHKHSHADSEKKELLGKLRTMSERSRRTVETLNRQMNETSRAGEYERFGSIIMGNLDQVMKGMAAVELPDIVTGEGTMKIMLDQKLSPVKNAERYFDKGKKAKLALKETEIHLREAAQESDLLGSLIRDLEECVTPDQVNAYIDAHRKELVGMHLVKDRKNAELPPFRVFTVSGGFEVWVGKSSANNDLLTMKYAKPNDLWFHARGSSGSHTVLKVRDANHPPGKEAIYHAGAIAAYYSKMRKSSNVPVAYCERKYVKKSKGLAEGAVILEREKVIFVTPRLPQPE
jgi:predicted ribosome quality control (RQC) complex YloA/Tae2 family protein